MYAAPGEMIALVGPTGAGKSTVVNLLPAFYEPTSGRILIDGQDTSGVSLESLRAQISVMSQEPFLFNGTIRENILYGKREATEEELFTASGAANCHEFISRLPQGYDTRVGERGVKLSVGGPFWQALTRNGSMVRLDKMARLSYLGKTKPPGLTNGRPQPIIWTLNACYKSPMEEIMVTKEYVELNTLKPGWQHQALQLARSQQPFVLTHFDAERDSEFYFALRGKFKLKAKMDYDGHAAIFNPKSSG